MGWQIKAYRTKNTVSNYSFEKNKVKVYAGSNIVLPKDAQLLFTKKI